MVGARVARHDQVTEAQVRVTTEITEWYLERYHMTEWDVGLPEMFFDERRVGPFAVEEPAFTRGDSATLFKVLATVVMFQRRSDAQIMRVLRSIPRADAEVMCSQEALLTLARGGCELGASLGALIERCDLRKDDQGTPTCGARPERPCHMKRHSQLLKRYGHFGKVHSSLALAIEERGGDLEALRREALRRADPLEAARWLEEALSTAWRISSKIACMFLSLLTAPDLSRVAPPWGGGSIDWRHFVVIDSNVDLALRSLGYAGSMSSYEARRSFLRALAERVDLSRLDGSLSPNNPRLIQQALYLFMSKSNRRECPRDCLHLSPLGCEGCSLTERCIAKRGG